MNYEEYCEKVHHSFEVFLETSPGNFQKAHLQVPPGQALPYFAWAPGGPSSKHLNSLIDTASMLSLLQALSEVIKADLDCQQIH